MSQTSIKPRKKIGLPTTVPEVLTLAEAAAFLRVSTDEILRLVEEQDLPGRLVGNGWRFLKLALYDWLRSPAKRGSKEAVLSAAGAWKDDPYVEEELKEIYKRRGRPMGANSR